jgi:predicted nuclease of restriction endonuclease-like (RecB) superfamily
MRAFAEAWADEQIVQQAVAQLPWGHNVSLLDRIDGHAERLWYVRQAIEHGWSRAILEAQIETRVHERAGKALTNFNATLPPPHSDLAQQTLEDPYVFDFLTLGPDAQERDLERGLLEHVRDFLLELGVGFAFVGSQVHLEVGGEDFYIDLLFFHLRLRCFVVLELKTGEFKPEYAGKMNFYLSAVDAQRRPDAPGIAPAAAPFPHARTTRPWPARHPGARPMSHSIPLYLALLTVPLGVACAKNGADAQAVPRSGTAETAQSDFAKAREDYRHEKQSGLDLLDKTITDLEGKEKIARLKAKTALDGAIPAVQAQRAAFTVDLRAIDDAGAAEWDSTKARLDKEWSELKAATDKAAIAAMTVGAAYKPGEMTCEDFVGLADIEKPKVVYWAEGFNKNGKTLDSVVDVTETDKAVPFIVSDCMKSPKETLVKAIQREPAATMKPVATAPKPAKMRCDEFVALEDVARPKVVYWAEGFNKDGGATDSLVDIAETDRLVPVLVQECTDEPKLTFWQKLKKYL